MSALLCLPQELLLQIWSYLSPRDLATLLLTSKAHTHQLTGFLYDLIFRRNRATKGGVIRRLSDRTYARAVDRALSCTKTWRSEFLTKYLLQERRRLFRIGPAGVGSWLTTIVGNGNTDLLAALNPSAEDLREVNKFGQTPLHFAVTEGHADTVRQLLKMGADVFTPGAPRCIFSYLPKEDSLEAAKVLIAAIKEAGGDLSARGADGHTALHWASIRPQTELVQLLLEEGADVLATNKYGHHPILYAVIRKRASATVQLLLNAMMQRPEYDIDAPIAPMTKDMEEPWINEDDALWYDRGDTLLHVAVRTWRDTTVKILLAAGASPIIFTEKKEGWVKGDPEPKTPFDIAVAGRAPTMVETIVAHVKTLPAFWPSERWVQRGYDTSVHEAYPRTVRVLLDLWKAGQLELDINPVDEYGQAPLLQVCEYYGSHRQDQEINDTVMQVVAAGANVNILDGKGRGILHYLVNPGYGDEHDPAREALMVFLLEHGADWRIQYAERRCTALHVVAARHFHAAIERILAVASSAASPEEAERNRALVFATDDEGRTALHHFLDGCWEGRRKDPTPLKGMELLVQAGFDINTVDNEGMTPVHHRLRRWVEWDELESLSQMGADWSFQDEQGLPIIHHLVIHYRDEVSFSGNKALRTMRMIYKYFVDVGANVHEACDECQDYFRVCEEKCSQWD